MPFWKSSRYSTNPDDRQPSALLADHAVSKYNDRSVVTSPTGENRTRHEARQSLRKELFTVGVHEISSDFESGLESNETLVSRGTGPLLSSGAASPTQEKARAEIENAITLLREIKKTASPGELAAIQNALSELSFNSTNSSVSCIPSEEQALNPLIRRKSIFTSPGAATRPRHHNVLKKTPPSKGLDKLYERADLEKQSGLERLMRDPKRHISGNPIIRTNTPSEFEYTHIGAHDYGTLRVMNGSPVPSLPSLHQSHFQSRPSTAGMTKEDDYFTASEGGGSPSLQGSSIPSTPNGDENNDPYLRERQTTPTPGDHASVLRTRSPNRPPGSPMGPRRIPLLRKGTDETITTHVSSIDRPFSPPKMYLTEASSNPYLPNHDGQTMLAAPKPTGLAAIPNLMRTGSVRTEDTDEESIYSPSAPNSQGTSFDEDEQNVDAHVPQRFPSISSSVYTTDTLIRRPTLDSLSGQRDSGYSSESSSRRMPQAEEKKTVAEPDTREPKLPNIVREPSYLQRKPLPSRPPVQVPTAIPRFAPYSGPCLSPVPSSRIMYGLPQKAASSGDVTRFVTDLTPSAVTSAPTTPDGRKKAKPNKLQKKRPIAERGASSPIVVQGQSPITTVPQIPFEIENAHFKRMSITPGMDHLEQTFDSVKNSARRMSSPEPPRNVEIRFPSPTPSPQQSSAANTQNRGRRRSWMMIGAGVLTGNRSKGSRERGHSLTTDTEIDGEYSNVADLGSVAQSLGTGPYDIAGQGRRYAPPTGHMSPLHPHQLGGNQAYRRSIGMDDKTASAFARMRSHDRVENFDNPDVIAARERKQTRAQRRNSFNNRRPRPQSQYSARGPPPLPAMPSDAGVRRIKSMYGSLKGAYDEDSDGDMVVETGHPSPQRGSFGAPDSTGEDYTQDSRPQLTSYHSMPDVTRTGGKSNISTPPKGILKKSTTNTPEDLTNWESSAKAWRMRRKSISEELRSRESVSPSPLAQDLDVSSDESTPIRSTGNRIIQAAQACRISPDRPLPRLPRKTPNTAHHRAPVDPSPYLHAPRPTTSPQTYVSAACPSPAPQLPELNLSSLALDKFYNPSRTASPTPSVLERARAFELAESRNPSRPPSPSKLPLTHDPRAASPLNGPRSPQTTSPIRRKPLEPRQYSDGELGVVPQQQPPHSRGRYYAQNNYAQNNEPLNMGAMAGYLRTISQ